MNEHLIFMHPNLEVIAKVRTKKMAFHLLYTLYTIRQGVTDLHI
jgi:hypothetical protein